MIQAAPLGDIFVTTTGCKQVIGAEPPAVIKDGAILANAGHFDVEMNKGGAGRLAEMQGRPATTSKLPL